MDFISNDNWVLSVGTFLPLAGVIIMMLIPKSNELLHKQIALVTMLATTAVGVFILFQFDYGNAGTLQFWA
ncbi:MAG TPA: NADH-quinone oxidoreductase subunit M, partial [Ilumatobacteraceae bacterium]|nr:NADH-quinone oxidoreductase subunit M [Ilumatobacteraceae bacterium]